MGTSPGMLKQGIVTWLGRPEDAGFEISCRFFFFTISFTQITQSLGFGGCNVKDTFFFGKMTFHT